MVAAHLDCALPATTRLERRRSGADAVQLVGEGRAKDDARGRRSRGGHYRGGLAEGERGLEVSGLDEAAALPALGRFRLLRGGDGSD